MDQDNPSATVAYSPAEAPTAPACDYDHAFPELASSYFVIVCPSCQGRFAKIHDVVYTEDEANRKLLSGELPRP